MPFGVAEFDPREVLFFHYDRAFRRYDTLRHSCEIGVSRLSLKNENGTNELRIVLGETRSAPSLGQDHPSRSDADTP